MQNHNIHKAKSALFLGILGNSFLFFVKLLSGIFGNSFALVADAIESLTDVISSTLLFFGFNYAHKPPDKDHPYGHGRAEPLMTFVVVIFLVISALIIARESIINIQTPHALPKPFTLYILAAIIVSKELFYRYSARAGEESESTSVKADAWHHRADALTSLAAFVGISFALIMGQGYEAADDWAALVACGIILYNAYSIFRPALGEIMDEHRYDDFVAEIRAISKNVSGVHATEKCFVRKQGTQYIIDIHLIVDGEITVRQGHDIAHQVKKTLIEKYPKIIEVMTHVEPLKKTT
ncbi:cation diffusion facilitator family transporter [Ornithobacterium rhinotracheale]|uniref:Cation diffusion facilitator family transporter n=1 Tax=Ornithobacterium rhinotracheale (strain ATCC 51463 / DSM 15997 / CCUG 23171 / CIP 104009 / LMG 9086) TaxID=867902 RepID=I4A0X0_ORNRL|nr:cation diffusion facilitator family transporter [Ornithobacterium rhinotracheale]AFL97604.1 cation diffusion facilitator family transporter [Ornithobacterium rhinotracheale DSM 15997]AIP98884.1 cobalt-zinc-cadmium resistance protein [Ornithobacterium rhinotracheale ORT-UMN 88]KGB66843.1 cobalt-zinc-cadmium resistance protein [Ornithobacterium rhinotracheale H06-030791]MCK0194995.1 cation diffusion facilitator family transporter [Ornithobacterium rhinotracheale]MCK0200511.1 cation diffusion 